MWWSRRAKSSRPFHEIQDWLLELSHLFDDVGAFREMAQGHFSLQCLPTLLCFVELAEVLPQAPDAVLDRANKFRSGDVLEAEPRDKCGQVIQPSQHCGGTHSCLACIDECTEWSKRLLEQQQQEGRNVVNTGIKFPRVEMMENN